MSKLAFSRPRVAFALCASAAALGVAHDAFAQAAQGEGPGLEEITVTARKRAEAILNVPVIEQAISAQKLEALQVTSMSDLPNLVPGLKMEHTFLSIGTLVSIRGIGTSSEDPGVQQSVGLNIDGLSLAQGLAYNAALFDVGQVEVLKGPQALFYGKSSPGGVISLRTADPGDDVEVIARTSYEFESIQPKGELIFSGPVTDTLKMRLATTYNYQEGYFKNGATALPGTGAMTSPDDRAPTGENYIVRLTALWDPIDEFSVRFKINQAYDSEDHADIRECGSASGGTGPSPGFPPFYNPADQCNGFSRTFYTVDLDSNAFPAAGHNGVPYLMTLQRYGTLEVNYRPTTDITLTSVTSYYNVRSASLVDASPSEYAGPFIGAQNRFRNHTFAEEVRANSEFAGPLNFTLGALYQTDYINDLVQIPGNAALGLPALVANGTDTVKSRTYSVFGQGRWDIMDRLELAAGLRYTDEKRQEYPLSNFTSTSVPVPMPIVHPRNVAPEITLTYRPTDDLTIYGALKRAYKSGGFSIATPVVANTNNAFGDEKVDGGEVGLKSRWLDHQISLNVAPYWYRYSGLQVGVISPPANGLPVIQTVNAAAAKTYGVDVDGTYRPASIEGLSLNGAALWNHARYLTFNNAPCWGGQTIALGCNQIFNAAAGAFTAQNLSGTPLDRAPDWQITFGFEYSMPIMDDYKLTFTNSNQFSSKYVRALALNYPGNANYQSAYTTVDLGVTLQDKRDRWELSLITKNVTDELISSHCEIGFVKGGAVVQNPSGTARPSPFGLDQEACFVDPGRQIWLRLTWRPFN